MQIHYTTELPIIKNAILTIGTFDGLHSGHITIINRLKALATQYNGSTVVVTFEPHPRTIVQPNALLQIITTATEKEALFASLGIDHLVIYPFTKAFASLSATNYIEQFIIGTFNPIGIVIGYDHHFGANRTGNITMLQQYANKGAFTLVEIPAHTINNNAISSTKIRNALLHGDIEKANTLLGYPYFFTGIVVQGKQLGRTIGYKTANIQIANTMKLIPGNGVYVVLVAYANSTLQGMMNIGTRPTVEGTNRTIEVHMLHFDEEIYGEQLTITLVKRLRNEQKFDDLQALKNQLYIDKKNTEKHFAN